MLVGLTGIILPSFMRYSLEGIHGVEALGRYASVATPAMILQAIAMAVFNPLANVFTIHMKEKNKQEFVKLFCIVFIIAISISAVFLAAAHFFGRRGLMVLFGPDITPFAFLLPGAIVAAGLTVLTWFMGIIYSITRDISGLLIGSIFGAVIAIASTEFFLANYDLEGANIAMIVSHGAVVVFLVARFLTGNKKIWKKIRV